MNRTVRGALTIEAAVVLPFVMLTLVSMLFIGKVYYIQDQIHGAMVKVAHEMSVDAYALDKIGLVGVQQEAYAEGLKGMDSVTSAAEGVINQKDVLKADLAQVTDFGKAIGDWSGSADMRLSEGDWLKTAREAMALMETAPKLASNVMTNLKDMVQAIRTLTEEAGRHLQTVAISEVVDLTNGALAAGMTEQLFEGYISEATLKAWGIEGVDFSLSTYMMPDDTVELVAFYDIDVPYGSRWWGQQIPVFQKVRVRAWSGSYDADEVKHRAVAKAGEATEEYFYIATASEGNHSYHYLQCLRPQTTASTYGEEVVEKGREVCALCLKTTQPPDREGPVWFVSKASKIHLVKNCSKINAITVKKVTEAAAIEMGKSACKKHGCVAKTRKAKVVER